MSTIELIRLIDLAWEKGFSIANIKPCLDKGYIHFRNSVFNELEHLERKRLLLWKRNYKDY